ncbi:MAG TPA: TIGR03067 domain-containing protein [Steroidobacteraceae bacterium]|nr:TIGR03067 domain-containing protein [Steroidobacteraceae bacterium]HNS26512.1 TIGR03067 domain-containing protein [Steroidobacteraceae bacterium]
MAKDRSTEVLERRLDGSWLPTAAFVAAEEVPVGELRVARLDLAAGRYRIFDREEQILDSGEYSIDAAVLPVAMDMVGVAGPNAGRRLEAIIDIEGDTLTVCYDLDGLARPESMRPEKDQLLLRISYARCLQRPS